MKAFKDNEGREWELAVTIASVKRVRDLLGVDLMALGNAEAKAEEQLLHRLMNDPILLCDVIYCICKREAVDKKISDEDFGRAMAGDAIDQATKALLEEIVNFTPNPRDRERARRVLKMMSTIIEKAEDLLDARVDNGELERRFEKAISTLGSPSTGSPESSESTPDR